MSNENDKKKTEVVGDAEISEITENNEIIENSEIAESIINFENIEITDDREVTDYSETTGGDNGTNSATKEIQERIEHLQSVSPEKKRKKRIRNIIFLLFNIVVLVLVFVLNPPATDESIVDVLLSTNGWYLLLAIATFVVVLLSEALIFSYLIKITTGRWRFKLSTKTALVGRYYDNITPLATGGQPFQMYTMNKAGVPGAVATSLPLVKYFTYMVLYCIIGFYVMVFRVDVLNGLDPVVRGLVITMGWVGLALNLALPMFILLCSVVRPLGITLLRFALRVGSALRLVKDPGRTYLKAQVMLTDYQKSLKRIAKFKHLFAMTLINILTYFTTAITPYFIKLAFTHGGFVFSDMMSTAMMTVIVLMASSFFPAPGAAGAAELSFGLVFAAALSSTVLPVALLTWRFITFYSFIGIGIGIIIYDQIRARRKERREMEKLAAMQAAVAADSAAGSATDNSADAAAPTEDSQ